MPANANPEAVRFANERLRPLADRLAQTYFAAKAVLAEWYANDLGSVLPAQDVIADGSAEDGRHPIDGNAAALLITRAADLVADYEASGNAKLNTVLAVAVNVEP